MYFRSNEPDMNLKFVHCGMGQTGRVLLIERRYREHMSYEEVRVHGEKFEGLQLVF